MSPLKMQTKKNYPQSTSSFFFVSVYFPFQQLHEVRKYDQVMAFILLRDNRGGCTAIENKNRCSNKRTQINVRSVTGGDACISDSRKKKNGGSLMATTRQDVCPFSVFFSFSLHLYLRTYFDVPVIPRLAIAAAPPPEAYSPTRSRLPPATMPCAFFQARHPRPHTDPTRPPPQTRTF